MTDLGLSNVEIRRSGFGLEVSIPFQTDLGNKQSVIAAVSEYGVNLAATGSLNRNGLTALNRVLAIATAIYETEYPASNQ